MLQEADRLLAGGADGAEVARELGVSEQTYYRWRNQFGGLKGPRRQTAAATGARERHVEAAAGGGRVGEGRVEGDRQGGILSPARRRAAVHRLQAVMGSVSGSRAGWSGSSDPPNGTGRRRRHRMIPTAGCGSGCAPTRPAIPAGVIGALITMRAPRAGWSTTRKFNGCGVRRASRCGCGDAANGPE